MFRELAGARTIESRIGTSTAPSVGSGWMTSFRFRKAVRRAIPPTSSRLEASIDGEPVNSLGDVTTVVREANPTEAASSAAAREGGNVAPHLTPVEAQVEVHVREPGDGIYSQRYPAPD